MRRRPSGERAKIWLRPLGRRLVGCPRTLAAQVSGFSLALALTLVLGLVPVATGEAQAASAVGQSATFWVLDWKKGTYSQTSALCRYSGEHAAIYVDEREWCSESLVSKLGSAFDSAVYPALVEAYGPEPSPGLDGDEKVAILLYDFNDPAVQGAFNGNDMDPQGLGRSNRREMFYLNLRAVEVEPANAAALAAHEFAHLLVYYHDTMLNPSASRSPEAEWLAEGLAAYGEYLAGCPARVSGQLLSFSRSPGLSLTAWEATRAHYGASYSFVAYLAERLGPQFLRALVAEPQDGVTGIEAVLHAGGYSESFASLFADWVIANFLDGRGPQQAPYCFSSLDIAVTPSLLDGAFPKLGSGTVSGYAATYLDFPACSPEATFQAVVDGQDRAPLEAALVSWDSAGLRAPVVAKFSLDAVAAGGTVTVPPGLDRHTLVVWARGAEQSASSYPFTFAGCPDPPGGVQFLDLSGDDPYYPYVASLLERGVVGGKESPAGSGLMFFAGGENVLRAQFAKMIMEATGLHTEEIDHLDQPTYKDVRLVYVGTECQAYPYDYVEEASSLGIVTGYADGTFRPYQPITRAQLVLMILRGAAKAGRPLLPYMGKAVVFADVPPSHLYYQQIMTAYSAGLVSGSRGSDGRLYFRPFASATRNHVAKITAGLLSWLED